ncbi:helix-turn-helix transcriptional regulator [Staphylococcus debuckii]|uniref:helix-turn-helix transcriptional regulator n=1 Tax=Staphylococcus debuckii TaxID=2044912 RepID=UPI000F42DC20|nr:helix-turn-helix transcriptional regulator [Staphylococcus debuckii]AYU54664.1 XRE family transcriptional regulator [Staphylococcus debuckii]
MDIKNNLKYYIKLRSVTQTQIVEATGITRPTLLKLIKEEGGTSIGVMLKLCDYFNITPNEFLGIEDKKTIQVAQKIDEIVELIKEENINE